MQAVLCPVCNGTGKVKKKTCHGCDGRGWVEVHGGGGDSPFPWKPYPEPHPRPEPWHPWRPYRPWRHEDDWHIWRYDYER